MSEEATAKDVAQWMREALSQWKFLEQDTAAFEIEKRFGEHFTYYNDNGNVAIKKAVLDAFRKLTDENVVWVRSERLWRYREKGDEPGRQQP